MNDTPKILAIGAAAGASVGVGAHWLFLLAALAMGAGSFLAGRRVTETLAQKVTRIAPDDGFAANLVTSALVGLASFLTLPVSTTHVSSGAILGIGLHRKDVRWRVVRDIVLAWIVTLPVAGVIASVAYVALSRLG
jgi:PiT family inorganic phosphate transporter